MAMRRQIAIGALVAVLAFGAIAVWRVVHVPQLPPRPLADMGAVKSDLFAYARAERAFYASNGRYASMQDLRSLGLLSVPPDIRWPYFYSIHTPAPDRFVIIAMAQGPFGARPIALSIDDSFNMREFDSHKWHRPENRRRRGATAQTTL
jgi:hypothetical protein